MPDGGCVRSARGKIEAVAFRELEIPFDGMEHNRTAQTEQHFVLVVLVPRVSVAGAIRPGARRPASVRSEGGECLLARRRARCQFRSHELGIVPVATRGFRRNTRPVVRARFLGDLPPDVTPVKT